MYKKLILSLLPLVAFGGVFADDVAMTVKVDSDWQQGYCFKFNINNISSKEIKSRTITFDIQNPNIYTNRSANFEKTSGGYKLTGLSWNDPLKVGQQVEIGYCTNSSGKPSNIKFDYKYDGTASSSATGTVNTGSSNNGNSIGNTTNSTGLVLTGTVVQPATGIYSPPFNAKDGKIYDSKNNIVQLRGVNWFGFETDNAVVHGLWTRNYKDMIQQMKDLGFNAVRLPYCPGILKGKSVSGIDYSKNSDLNGLNSLQIFDKIISTFASEGFYILLDMHRSDCNSISDNPNINGYNIDDWINDLVTVAKRYKDVPNVIAIDPKNEPHGQARWGTLNQDTDRKLQVEKAGQAILNANPNLLIFVEGVESNGGSCESSSNHWWGGNIEPISCYPIDSSKIPSNKLILSPHVYGPDVYMQPYFKDDTFPLNMKKVWDDHFGRFVGQYTVVPGEFGGKYGDGNSLDVKWQNAFIDYLIAKGITNFFFWSWNPNSGDTGGILKDDWTTVNTAKYNNLKRLFPTSSNPSTTSTGSISTGDLSTGNGQSDMSLYYSVIDTYFSNLSKNYTGTAYTSKLATLKTKATNMINLGVIQDNDIIKILQYIVSKIGN